MILPFGAGAMTCRTAMDCFLLTALKCLLLILAFRNEIILEPFSGGNHALLFFSFVELFCSSPDTPTTLLCSDSD